MRGARLTPAGRAGHERGGCPTSKCLGYSGQSPPPAQQHGRLQMGRARAEKPVSMPQRRDYFHPFRFKIVPLWGLLTFCHQHLRLGFDWDHRSSPGCSLENQGINGAGHKQILESHTVRPGFVTSSAQVSSGRAPHLLCRHTVAA